MSAVVAATRAPSVGWPRVDAYLAVVSKREVRDVRAARARAGRASGGSSRPGRVAGSLEEPPGAPLRRRARPSGVREEVASSECDAGDNVRGAALVVAIVVGRQGADWRSTPGARRRT